jgi:apolipoprotein N-acyltransferase
VQVEAGRRGAALSPSDWLARRSAPARVAVASLAGAAITLGQPPVSAPLTLFLALPVLVWLLDAAPSPRAAAVLGWAAGFGHFVTGLHWMGHAFLVDAERFAWMLPFAVTLLPAFIALFWALAFAAARALWRPGWTRAPLLAGALATAELARSFLFTGLPWGLPAYAWVETPVMQAAAWAGPHGLTLLTLALAALPLAAGLLHPAGLAALAAVAALWGAGVLRVPEATAYPQDATVLRIVQPNAEQHLKWRAGHRERYAARLRRESAADPDPALGRPHLVIWPETAITFLPQDAPGEVAEIAASARGATLVTGALFYRMRGGLREWSNALMAVGPEGRILHRYDKHHLVPFGEYLPLRGLLERIGLEEIAGMGGAGFEAGPGPETVALPGLPAFAPAICYEMIFPHEVVADAPRPGFILHVTNDAWFGSFAGPQQHLAQARIRAIEQGLPVARAANTGISAVIDAHGRVRASLALGAHGRIDAALPEALPPTLYARTGDWPALAALALLWAGLLLRRAPLDRPRGPCN